MQGIALAAAACLLHRTMDARVARKFLYVVAALIVLSIAAAFAYRIWGAELMRMALVPTARFDAAPRASAASYASPRMWFARPDIANNPALWLPQGVTATRRPPAAVFFIHPTSYIDRARWNATLDDPDTNARAAIFLRGQASAFSAAGEIWAPRYRQATFGAFLTSLADAERALSLAYGDVQVAFDAFLAQIGPDRPIILAGHSQGALHLTHLLKDRVAGTPLARRIVAAYVVGWPVSQVTDLAALGLPECTHADQSGCLLSWQTFAEPADPALIVDTYDRTTGFDGRPRRGTPFVCTNPLTGTPGAAAAAQANLGTLYPSADLRSATMLPGRVPARCGKRGLLMIGAAPDVGPFVLPGNNYHVYDYSLFWANVRADALRRLAAFQQR
jgi:hypothetical protein